MKQRRERIDEIIARQNRYQRTLARMRVLPESAAFDSTNMSQINALNLIQRIESYEPGNYQLKRRFLINLQRGQGNYFTSDLLSRHDASPSVDRSPSGTMMEEEAEVTYQPHHEGGWLDTESGCRADDEVNINQAMAHTHSIVNNWNLPHLGRLRTTLSNKLPNVHVNCRGEDCSGIEGRAPLGGNSITICPSALSADQGRLNAVVFHELIHSCRGQELDSEALEAHYFSDADATAPTSGDFTDFQNNGGEYTIWDSNTGEVFEKKTDGTRGNALAVDHDDFKPGGW